MHRILAVALALALGAFSARAEPVDWRSPIARDHPLVGRIWQPASAAFVAPGTVEAAAAMADVVLLGEKHDNEDHHLLQARLIRAMTAAGRRPAVVFEMITEDRQAVLDGWLSTRPADAAGLGAAVGWEESGWPAWSSYRPIAEAALDASLPLLAGNPPRRTAKDKAQAGSSPLDPARRARLGLDEPLSPQNATTMTRELFQAHCELVPEASLAPIVQAQRARDAVLADNVAKALAHPESDGAVLITGGGHARSDLGVPLYLSRLAPGRSLVTIVFLEVADDATTPEAYGERYQGAVPFDFLWFTPRANDHDYCLALTRKWGQG
jgi:uncharacterized iron-regulated protein